MFVWHFSDADVAANLAWDEALIEWADDTDGSPVEVLRLWESPQLAVIAGRSSKLSGEIQLDTCRAKQVPVLRRCSGGASVVIGPGCLMYSLLLSVDLRPACRSVSEAHCLVMTRWKQALAGIGIDVQHQGNSDLTLKGKKVSGNSLRCKRRYLLYHGTMLYDFDVDHIHQLLRMPPRQPDYRNNRDHLEFVANLPADPAALRTAIANQWDAREPFGQPPREQAQRLLADKYQNERWHRRHE